MVRDTVWLRRGSELDRIDARWIERGANPAAVATEIVARCRGGEQATKQLAGETVLEAGPVALIVAFHCFVWRAGPLRLRDDSSCEGMPACPEREIAWSPMQKPVDLGRL
jgi:hypothetical protein